MAKKKTNKSSSTTSTTDITKFCAFWGLVIAAIVAIVSFVIAVLAKCGVPMGWASTAVGVLSTISQIALLIAVIIPAYRYSRGKSTVWRAFFWVAIIFIVLGLVGINLI